MQKLGIGTVQFGQDYGITNQRGQTSLGEVGNILQFAQENGIYLLDTAPAYGKSESVLGKLLSTRNKFKIIIKSHIFKKEKIDSYDVEKLKETFYNSLKNLKQKSIEGILIHHVNDILVEGGEKLYKALEEFKNRKLVGRIGVSVYTANQIVQLLGKFNFDLIQLPVNVLDQRLINSGCLRELKKRGIEIHARSIFLQGLLIMAQHDLHSFFEPIKPLLKRYNEFLHSHNLSLIEGAFCFIKQIPEIDFVIIGINNVEQLQLNLKAFTKLYTLKLNDFTSFSLSNLNFLNPNMWRI